MTAPSMSDLARYKPRWVGTLELNIEDRWRATWVDEQELPEHAPVFYLYALVFKGDKGKPVPTGLRVGDGDRFIISASGSIWSGVVFTSETGPQGWFDAAIPGDRVAGRDFPVPGRPPFSLIAGYDNRDWFYVGSAYDHTYRGPERDLWLSINDTNLSRGKGFFEVRVEIRRRAR